MQTWLHVINWRATTVGDTLAVSDKGQRLSYREFHQRVEDSAAKWYALGVRSDDVVAVIAHNSVEFLVQVLALFRVGALPLLLNWRMPRPEVDKLWDVATPVAVFADTVCAGLVEGHANTIRVLDGAVRDGWIHLSDVEGEAAPYPAQRLHTDQTAFLIHTSGTTGMPKILPMEHGALIRSLAGFAIEIGDQKLGSRHLIMMPMFHLAGFAQAMQCFLTAGTLFIQDGFDVNHAIDTIVAEKINFFTAAPVIISALADAMEGDRAGEDISSLIEIQYGSAPIQTELLQRAVRVVCPRLRQIYGNSELQGFLTTLRPQDHIPGDPRLASAGQIGQGWDVRIVAADGAPVPADTAGEIQVRGDCVIKEYWRNAEQTRAAFTEDGWYCTGDMATLSEDKYLTIVGRCKDMIVSGGENVYPAEIEAVLTTHPGVLETAVVAAAHPRWGETPVAFIVSDTAEVPTRDALSAYCRERLAGFKCPSAFRFIDALPRNGLGKVQKFALREQLSADDNAGVS